MSSGTHQEVGASKGTTVSWLRPDVALVLRATLWIVAIFGALRLAPVERAVLLLAELQ